MRVVDDEPAVHVDDALPVVGEHLGGVGIAHPLGLGLAEDQDRFVTFRQHLLPARASRSFRRCSEAIASVNVCRCVGLLVEAMRRQQITLTAVRAF